MPTINKLTKHWRRWINRSKSFESKVLDELESHLLEEIDNLVEKDGISEEEAFNKAVIDMGNRENLDQKFTKVRGFPVKKVKHWFAIHSWVMGAVIVGLIISTVTFSSKRELSPYINKESIGDYEAIFHPYYLDSNVSTKDRIYSLDHSNGNILMFKINEQDCKNEKTQKKPIWIDFIGTYFSEIPENFKISSFDVDEQERFYFLLYNEQHSAEEIVIYHNGKIEKKISLTEIKEKISRSYIKVIDRTVVLGKQYSGYPQYCISNLSNEILYFNLDEENINAQSLIIPVKSDPINYYLLDRAGRKLIVLTRDGQLLTYELKNKTFVLADTQDIKNFSEIPIQNINPEDTRYPDSFSTAISSIICSNNDKIILSYLDSYYLISRFNDPLITVKPLMHETQTCYLKINHHDKESLVLIDVDSPGAFLKIYSLK